MLILQLSKGKRSLLSMQRRIIYWFAYNGEKCININKEENNSWRTSNSFTKYKNHSYAYLFFAIYNH